jgi:hypothetical protein
MGWGEDILKIAHNNPDVTVDGDASTTTARHPQTHADKFAAKFRQMWHELGGPPLEDEVRFHPTRRWRFDFAHKATWTAIELEGGIFQQGRHNRGIGYQQDCRKYNAAAAQGWTVFRLATGMLTPDDIGPIIDYIEAQQG